MKLPRDLSGRELAKSLAQLGYSVTRQTSSHIRLTTQQGGEHHVTIPDHNPLKVGPWARYCAMWLRTLVFPATKS